jgi:hypothetical protein
MGVDARKTGRAKFKNSLLFSLFSGNLAAAMSFA